MSRINILFTTSAAPEKSPFFTTEKRPPLGVGFMISLLKNQGHTVFFIDNYLKPSRFIEEGYLQKNRIDYVGIYANTICYRDTLRMFNAIEQLRQKGVWQGKIIVGGPHTAVAPQTIPEFVDHIVLGEGEQAIQDILDGTTSDRIIRHPRLEDLDSLPFQPWDIFTALPYDFTCPWMDIQPVFTMNTSRGCMYTCNFCSASVIWERKYTCFSDERIIAEIEYLIREHQAKGIYFREDHFTLSNKRTQQFCQSLLDKSISISWACETRVDNLDEELIELMSKSGCRALYLGVESGSQRMLDVMKKGITVDQIKNVITWCHNFNIRTYCSLITGLPGETHEDYRLTKQLMEELKPYKYSFNVFVGIPGSPLYKHVVEKNLYEHMDDLKLAYLPGYNVKTRLFYDRDSKELVDHTFLKSTEFDRKLKKELWRRTIGRWAGIVRKCIGRMLPSPLKERIKSWIQKSG